MKKIITAVTSIGLILLTNAAWAAPLLTQNFTQNEFTTAESLDPGMTQTGINFTLGDHYKNYYPEIRYGLGALTEVGVKFGISLARVDGMDKLGGLLGVDIKHQLIKETTGIPLDMAVDIGFDNTIIKKKNASEITFSTIFSKSYPLTERGYKFIPYGGLEMASLGGSAVESDTSVYVFGGFEWKLSQKFMVLMEFKGGHRNLGGIAIRFEY